MSFSQLVILFFFIFSVSSQGINLNNKVYVDEMNVHFQNLTSFCALSQSKIVFIESEKIFFLSDEIKNEFLIVKQPKQVICSGFEKIFILDEFGGLFYSNPLNNSLEIKFSGFNFSQNSILTSFPAADPVIIEIQAEQMKIAIFYEERLDYKVILQKRKRFKIGGSVIGKNFELFFSDPIRHCIIRIRNELEDFIGVCGQKGFNVGHDFSSALMNTPLGLALVEKTSSLFFVDSGNHCVRKINLNEEGPIFSIAGNCGISGDKIEEDSLFYLPSHLWLDSNFEKLFVVDQKNQKIKTISFPFKENVPKNNILQDSFSSRDTCQDPNCISCLTTDPNNCTSCTNNFFLFNSSCVRNCEIGFFGDLISKNCVPCDPSCETCSNSAFNSCLSCYGSNLTYLGQCFSSCPSGSFQASSSSCQSCFSSCLNCTGPNLNDCSVCPLNKLFYNGYCLDSCPEKTFNSNNQVCLNCNSPCGNCIGNANSCTSCGLNYFLLGNSCVNPCPDGFFSNGNICSPCDFSCKTCNGNLSSQCLSCSSNKVFFNSTCLLNCPNSFYNNSGNCLDCHPNCFTCNNGGSNSCLSCSIGKFLFNNTCVNSCPDGFFSNGNICSSCHFSCKTCNGNLPSQCLSCSSPNFLSSTSCVLNCPSLGFYPNLATRTCSNCDPICANCNGESDFNCTGCFVGFFPSSRTCSSSCSIGFYFTGSSCSNCNISCNSCNGATSSDCLSCPGQKVLFSRQCLNSCPFGTYSDSNRICKSCGDPLQCLVCSNSSLNGCLSCRPGSYLLNGICSTNCPVGTFIDVNSGSCKNCDSSCNSCSGSSSFNCLSCSNGKFLFSGQCLSNCPDGYFPNSIDSTCRFCSSSCFNCFGPFIENCISCDSNLFLDSQNRCVSSCSLGQFANSLTGKCENCSSSCLSCNGPNSNNCLSCFSNTTLSLNQCLKSCPLGSFSLNKVCQPCFDPNCAICNNGSSNDGNLLISDSNNNNRIRIIYFNELNETINFSSTTDDLLNFTATTTENSNENLNVTIINYTLYYILGAVFGFIFIILIIGFIIFIIFYVKKKNKQNRRGKNVDEIDLNLNFERNSIEMNRKSIIESNSFILSNIKIENQIGSGQFGSVFKGIWNKSTIVALKTLTNEEAIKDFLQELEILQKLQHSNIVQYLGVFKNEQINFIVTEFMNKGSLLSLLQEKNYDSFFQSENLLDFCKQACNGMVYLSSQNIIHRDLAVRNLLVNKIENNNNKNNNENSNNNSSFIIKIADFGLSRVLENHYYTSSNNMIPIKWSPPEVLEKRIYSSKSDIWSFGIVIWEIFSFGKKPYPGMTNMETAEKVLEGYRMENPNKKICSNEIYQIMLDCWKKEKNERPNFQEIYQKLNF